MKRLLFPLLLLLLPLSAIAADPLPNDSQAWYTTIFAANEQQGADISRWFAEDEILAAVQGQTRWNVITPQQARFARFENLIRGRFPTIMVQEPDGRVVYAAIGQSCTQEIVSAELPEQLRTHHQIFRRRVFGNVDSGGQVQRAPAPRPAAETGPPKPYVDSKTLIRYDTAQSAEEAAECIRLFRRHPKPPPAPPADVVTPEPVTAQPPAGQPVFEEVRPAKAPEAARPKRTELAPWAVVLVGIGGLVVGGIGMVVVHFVSSIKKVL